MNDLDLTQQELVLNRIVDGEESPQEWRAFAEAADSAPALWRVLAIEQRQARMLGSALCAEVGRAGLSPLAPSRTPQRGLSLRQASKVEERPELEGGVRPALSRRERSTLACDHARDEARRLDVRASSEAPAAEARRRVRGEDPRAWRGAAGWLLAACLAGAWLVSASLRLDAQPASGFGRGTDAGQSAPAVVRASFVNPAEALQSYLDLGRRDGSVVGELPGKPLLEKRPLENGAGFEVVYLRQIIEKRHVPAMYDLNQVDEFGRVVAAPIVPRDQRPL